MLGARVSAHVADRVSVPVAAAAHMDYERAHRLAESHDPDLSPAGRQGFQVVVEEQDFVALSCSVDFGSHSKHTIRQ